MKNKKQIKTALVQHNYKENQKLFENAAEAAFSNIQWINHKTDFTIEQSIRFKLGTSYSLMCVISIVEEPMSELLREISGVTSSFFWKVHSYLINEVRDRLVSTSRFTQRQVDAVAIVCEAAMFGVNNGAPRETWLEGNILIGKVKCTPEDILVIAALIAEIKGNIDEKISSNGGVMLSDNLSPNELPQVSDEFLDENPVIKDAITKHIHELVDREIEKPKSVWTPVTFDKK